MNYYEAARFIVILSIAGMLLGILNYYNPDMSFEKKIVAEHTVLLLNTAGVKASTITAGGKVMIITKWLEVEIIPACVGWIGLFAVSALIIAYPARLKKKLFGLALALPAMYTVNILRLFTTVIIGYYKGINALAFAHNFLWKTTLILSAFIIWVAWIWFVVEEKKLKDLAKLFKSKVRIDKHD